MGTASEGETSFYLDDFADEFVPCETSLKGWAEWLTAPVLELDEEGGNQWGLPQPPKAGDTFEGTAMHWKADIVARRVDGVWTFSREPEPDDFMAVRWGEGMGWGPEQIVDAGFSTQAGFLDGETESEALRRWFREFDADCEDQEFVAVGRRQGGLRFTLISTDPAHLTVEAVQ